MASIRDVAAHAGVSTATVSRVLTDKGLVRPEVRHRVLQAVQQLDYRPNRAARSLRSNQSATIGLIVADIQNSYFTAVARAVEDQAQNHDMAVFLCNSDEDPGKEAMYLQLMRDENVAGVILSPTARTARDFDHVQALGLPVVVIDRCVNCSTVDTITIDNVAAARELTQQLIAADRRRVAGLFGLSSITAKQRYEGFRQAITAAGLTEIPSLIRWVPPREQAGYDATRQLLAADDPPDALLTSNGLLGAGAYRAIHDSDVPCPRQLAFACFDETTWAQLVQPPVTTVEQPTYDIGSTAAELLFQRITTPTRPARDVILQYRIIPRRSCLAE